MTAQQLLSAGWTYLNHMDRPPLNKRIEFARDERYGEYPNWFGNFSVYPPEFDDGIKGIWWRRAV